MKFNDIHYLLIGLIFNRSTLIHLSTATSVFIFLVIQNIRVNDEAFQKRTSDKAAVLSFQIQMILLISGSIIVAFIHVLSWLSLSKFLSFFVGLGFMKFVFLYDYYNNR